MENLSHEHVGSTASQGDDVNASRETARPKRIAVEPGELQKKLPDVADEPPPPGLWTKLESQLRREGIIR